MAKHKEKEENKKQEKAAKVVKQSELSKDEQILQINIGNQAQEQVFADPTYDATFKMLFGKQANIDITKSFLNTMLGFTGTKEEIAELKIISSDLIQEDVNAIESAIDVRCKTVSGQDISIEMQRRGEEYFLARTQDYMAKILSSQVTKSDGGKKYHLAMDKTYMLVVSKAQLFLKGNQVPGDTLIMYEKTIVPMIKELGVEVPGNKMYWKFFELPKFKNYIKNQQISYDSDLKEQWLDFLLNCSECNEIPEDRNDIIKRGYEIMKIANWTKEDRDAYELSKLKEAYALKEEEAMKQEAEKIGFDKGLEKGKWHEKYKGEISKIKMGLEANLEDEKILKNLSYTKDKFSEFKTYFEQHRELMEIDDNESEIMGEMGIEYQDII